MKIFSNGVDGSTGNYLLDAMGVAELAQRLRSTKFEHIAPRTLQTRFDAHDLAQAGWAIVYPHDIDPAVREALTPLTHLRRSQATVDDRCRYRELEILPDESKLRFLARHGAGPGPVDPRRVPYYLLLVGSPEQIPFSVQFALGMQYAVGRVEFDDPDEYRAYAECVLAEAQIEVPPSSKAPSKVPPSSGNAAAAAKQCHATLFGVQNDDDPATAGCVRQLVEPLRRELAESCPRWSIDAVLRADATKQRLHDLLHQPEPPSLLLTASHALGFKPGRQRQRPHQGALLCADWPGPKAWSGRIPESFYFAGDDLAASAQLRGMISIHFACFTAGTPRTDSFPWEPGPRGGEIAPADFVARLPQALLKHGAQAVVGHVDRAWHHSYSWNGAGSQVQSFASVTHDLLQGAPVGHATRHFGQRYAEMSTEILFARDGEPLDDTEQVHLWTACNDARGYSVLGDPAVRLHTPRTDDAS